MLARADNSKKCATTTRLLRKDLNTAFPEQRIAGLRPANPERRNPGLRPALPAPQATTTAFGGLKTDFGRHSPSNASQAYGLHTPSDAIRPSAGIARATHCRPTA